MGLTSSLSFTSPPLHQLDRGRATLVVTFLTWPIISLFLSPPNPTPSLTPHSLSSTLALLPSHSQKKPPHQARVQGRATLAAPFPSTLSLSREKKIPNPNTLTLLSLAHPFTFLSSSRRWTLVNTAPTPSSPVSFALLPFVAAPSPLAHRNFLPLFPSLSSPIRLCCCCYCSLLSSDLRRDAAPTA